MRISLKFFQRRCSFCKRRIEEAKNQQVAKLGVCDVTPLDRCPFYSYISDAIAAFKEEHRIELLRFDISRDEVLEGETIQVSWETRNCKRAYITNFGQVDSSGVITLLITRGATEVEICFVDLFDQDFLYTRPITVHRGPTLTITKCTEIVVYGESFSAQFTATNAGNINVLEEYSGKITDLTNTRFFESEPLTENQKFVFRVVGKYGGEAKEEINVIVVEPPRVSYFICDTVETVDTLPLTFSFDYQNAVKAELYCNGVVIADVTGKKTHTHIAENKTNVVWQPRFILNLTGQTGATRTAELSERISIYPQPSIAEIRCSPDNVILFPEPIVLTSHSLFCESILVSDGETIKLIQPNTSVIFNPSYDTEYVFTPIGKQNFHGGSTKVLIQVAHPIKIKATADKKVTLPNLPVTISWQSKNHTQVIIEPGGIDVTNRNSYNVRLEKKTVVEVWGINQKDRKSSEVFIDVLAYPKFNGQIFGGLPKIQLQLPRAETFRDVMSKDIAPDKLFHLILSKNLSSEIVSFSNLATHLLSLFKSTLPKTSFNLSRAMRYRLFREIKKLAGKT